MIVVGIFLIALALIGCASSALDPSERKESLSFDALLFLLCLVGVVAAHKRKSSDEDLD